MVQWDPKVKLEIEDNQVFKDQKEVLEMLVLLVHKVFKVFAD
jgi:hypothetical protein